MTTAPKMKNHRNQPSPDDHPLAANEFFRRAEEAVEVDDEANWAEEDDAIEEDAPAHAMVEEAPRRSLLAVCGWTVAGLATAVAGASVILGPSFQEVLQPLQAAGVTPFAVAVAGMLAAVLGSLRAAGDSRAAQTAWRLDQLEQGMQSLAPGQADQIGEAGHILVALQRQDEKLNNLTRATKLYGKPLAEVTEQVHEIAQGQAKLDLDVANLERAMQNATAAVEAQLAGRLEAVTAAVQQLERAVHDSRTETNPATPWTREEAREDLADAVTQVRSALRELDAGAPQQPVVLDSLEDAVTTIQREIQALATSVARIEAQRPTAISLAKDGPAPRPEVTPPAAPAPTAQSGVGDLAQSIAGERKATGKNVLGAIAKLKSMRS
ncbi:MAG: hypothetical protein ACO3UM_15320 [Planctomycetota bacterium]